MSNYYNENDPFAAQWLRNLIAAKLLPDGYVDERSIKEVQPSDLRGYSQCHFFAGIGGWPLALQYAGWPGTRKIWTGSCPCQPFSDAGQGKGIEDERHLWPEFFRLIEAEWPECVVGEQVASKDGLEWFAGIQADLERAGYRSGGVDLCTAGIGAPHIRQRLYWMADTKFDGQPGRLATESREGIREIISGAPVEFGRCGDIGGLQHPESDGRKQRGTESSGRGIVGRCGQADGLGQPTSIVGGSGSDEQEWGQEERIIDRGIGEGGVGESFQQGLEGLTRNEFNGDQPGRVHTQTAGSITSAGAWDNYLIAQFADGKARRIGLRPVTVADGLSGRVGELRPIDILLKKEEGRKGKLKGYGNAIVPQLAAEFIKAYMSIL